MIAPEPVFIPGEVAVISNKQTPTNQIKSFTKNELDTLKKENSQRFNHQLNN